MATSFDFRASIFLVAFASTAAACFADGGASESIAAGTDALTPAKVFLPESDACREVLAPLALGLADGAAGLAFTQRIDVSLTSETDTRLYAVAIEGQKSSAAYEVELDNDSVSKCFLLSAKSKPEATLENDRRTAMTQAEWRADAPVTVVPAQDDCASTVKLLGRAAAVSAVGPRDITSVTVSLAGAEEERGYSVHVDGRAFVVNGQTFPNDYDFALSVSNDSAFKCFVEDVHAAK
jgi:hypothetical protein